MKVLAVVLVILSQTSLAAVADSERSTADTLKLPKSGLPYLERSELVANAENTFRTFVPANEQVGVSQIRALVGQTEFEEEWAFVPSANVWIEIGRKESVTEIDSEVAVDTDYLKQIVSLYHSVAIVHFHPAGFYRRIWQQEPYPIGFPVGLIAQSRLQPIGFALPSPDDVVSSIELSRELLVNDPAARISYAVVSPYGVVTYGLTTAGLKTVVYDWGNPRATTARSIVSRIAIRRMPFNIASTTSALTQPTIGDVIEALCEQASDENYRLTFKPF